MLKFDDFNQYESVWRTGRDPVTEQAVTVRDAIASPNASVWLPKVIENVVREAIEPLLIGTSLLTRIQHKAGQTISFPAVGALTADDIGEGMAYPEKQLQMGGATVTANVGKSGVAFKVTDEMIEDSMFDVIGMHMRAAANALARHKEVKCFNFITEMGTPIFNNADPTSSLLGVTHGRDIAGAANGALTMDDVFDMLASVMHQGFIPDTILVHPLTWIMWVKDAQMRDFARMNQSSFFMNWNGNPATRANWANMGGLGVGNGQNITPGGNAAGLTPSGINAYSQTMTSAPVLPSYFGFPMRILVSPMVRFDPANKLTDIVMFDSRELGAYIVQKEVTVDEWKDPSVDIRKVKLMEKYGFAIFNEGQGIATAKNVKVIPNELSLPVQTVAQVSTNFAPIPATVPVV